MKASKILISLLLLLALCVGLMSGTALAEGAIAAVDRGGSQEEMGSLEEAINAAQSGDRVVLLQRRWISAAKPWPLSPAAPRTPPSW